MKIGLLSATFVAFLVLKLCHVIGWSWWWVAAPLWIPVAAIVALILCVFVGAMAMEWTEGAGRIGTPFAGRNPMTNEPLDPTDPLGEERQAQQAANRDALARACAEHQPNDGGNYRGKRPAQLRFNFGQPVTPEQRRQEFGAVRIVRPVLERKTLGDILRGATRRNWARRPAA